MIAASEIPFIESHLAFYVHLSESEKSFLENALVLTSFKKDTLLKNDMMSCPGIIIIKSGTIRVSILSDEGREITLYRLSKGEICTLSASCILTPVSFNVQITAESDVDLFLVPAHLFAKISKQNVYVENFVYKITIERFSDVMRAVEQLFFTRLDVRLAQFLLAEDVHGSADGCIHITQEELARNLGSVREVVSRTLKSFQSGGVILQKRGSIKIIDRQKLKSAAGQI